MDTKTLEVSANRRDDVVVENSLRHTSTVSAREVPVAAGSKRTRGLDESEDRYNLTPDTGEVCASGDATGISTIIMRAKRLRIGDSAPHNGDEERHHFLILDAQREEKKHASLPDNTQNLMIPETPSLSGLPEELIIEILQNLVVCDIMAFRRTCRRVAYVTRARVLWITHFRIFLEHMHVTMSPTALLHTTQLSSSALERAVKRPHIFNYAWFRSHESHEVPITSHVLSTSWSKREDIRLPILMPGGRWLIAVGDNVGSLSSCICLWDLDRGTPKRLPEMHIVAEGRVFSLDMKVDRTGAFAFVAVISEQENVVEAGNRVHQVDIYKIDFKNETDALTWQKIDSLLLTGREASEVQIYPQYGRVIVDLFGRVLLWDYAPINKCACLLVARPRRNYEFAHAITLTHQYLLVADGDTSVLKAWGMIPLVDRPVDFTAVTTFGMSPHLVLNLPSHSSSLRFSSERSVNISAFIEAQKALKRPLNSQALPLGVTVHVAEQHSNSHEIEHYRKFCSDPSGRGFLFVDAASSDSYFVFSFPLHDISTTANSPNSVCITSRNRGDARTQARSGSLGWFGPRPSIVPERLDDQKGMRESGDALWVGTIGGFSSELLGRSHSPGFGARNVVLLRNPDENGRLFVLSTAIPFVVDLGPGQSRIDEIEQGAAKTVLRLPPDQRMACETLRRVGEATVDEISGKMCIVERITLVDGSMAEFQSHCKLHVLEYA